MEELKIIELIERNPVTKLSNTYNVKLLEKIKSNFTEFEQHIFLGSFYCYVNYDKLKDFVVDLDNVWSWLGFTLKENAKRMLVKHFIIDIDYKSFDRHFGRANSKEDESTKTLYNLAEQKKGSGGHNKTTIMMTIKCFKSLCLKAQTKKATEIHEYYMKLEEIVQEVVDEETCELRKRLVEQNLLLQTADKEKELIRENTLLEQFPDNIQCVYYGFIDNVNSKNEQLIKFGCSNFLSERVKCHKKTYTNFRLANAFKVCNKTQIENAMKNHPALSQRRRQLVINDIKQMELLSINKISVLEIDDIIKDIIKSIEYSQDNYTYLLTENDNLKRDVQILREQIEEDKYNKVKVFSKLIEEKNVLQNILIQSLTDEDEDIRENEIKKMKRCNRQTDGLFYIGGKAYEILLGTRQEVWDGIAYKTAGQLIKSDLTIGSNGNVVSKKKFVSATKENRIMIYMKQIGKVK